MSGGVITEPHWRAAVTAAGRRRHAQATATRKRSSGMRMEVACCDADHEGVWEGEWEECEVLVDHGGTCDVRIVEDGEVCSSF